MSSENARAVPLMSGVTNACWASLLASPEPGPSADGRYVAAAAGPNRIERRFGQERGSYGLLARDGSSRSKLTASPPGRPTSCRAGLPTSSSSSSSVAASVATRWRRAYSILLRVDDGRLLGPLARVGSTSNYYGHSDWADWIDSANGRRRIVEPGRALSALRQQKRPRASRGRPLAPSHDTTDETETVWLSQIKRFGSASV